MFAFGSEEPSEVAIKVLIVQEGNAHFWHIGIATYLFSKFGIESLAVAD